MILQMIQHVTPLLIIPVIWDMSCLHQVIITDIVVQILSGLELLKIAQVGITMVLKFA